MNRHVDCNRKGGYDCYLQDDMFFSNEHKKIDKLTIDRFTSIYSNSWMFLLLRPCNKLSFMNTLQYMESSLHTVVLAMSGKPWANF